MCFSSSSCSGVIPACSLPCSPNFTFSPSIAVDDRNYRDSITFYVSRSTIPRPPPGGTLVPPPGRPALDFFPVSPYLPKVYPIVSLSLRRRFERSAPFSFHSRTREPAVSHYRPPRRGRPSGHVNSRRVREEGPLRKRAPCYEREKESAKEGGEERKKRERAREGSDHIIKIRKWFCVRLRRDTRNIIGLSGQRMSGRIGGREGISLSLSLFLFLSKTLLRSIPPS